MAEPLPDHPDFLWRNPEPKASYDVVIVGAGGHGLATAYYLAKNHGLSNIAVLERGWLAGGNMARNTAIIRSNYLWDESSAIFEHSLKLWEGLPQLGTDHEAGQCHRHESRWSYLPCGDHRPGARHPRRRRHRRCDT
jgi:glycine/D-amino acid oxidase-like deaminating enzyme